MPTSSELAEHRQAEAELKYCVEHVPPAVNNGSYNLSVDFKKAVVAARRLIGKRGVKTHELQSAVRGFQRFWETT